MISQITQVKNLLLDWHSVDLFDQVEHTPLPKNFSLSTNKNLFCYSAANACFIQVESNVDDLLA